MQETKATAATTAKGFTRPEISVVVPVFNEQENIRALANRLVGVLTPAVQSFEVIFVDDGSRDATLLALKEMNAGDARVSSVVLSRNFGKEVAIAAGLDAARGDAVVIMDADLQHPPEVIPSFIAKWREGYRNVYGERIDRAHDSQVRRFFAKRFYKLFEAFGEIALPPGAGDFRLLDRQAVVALQAMGERARFSKGLYSWIGFKSVGVPFDVAPRAAGQSKFSYRKLTRFALDGLMSFSSLPLRVWTYVGTAISSFALSMALYFLIETLIYGARAPGFPSLIVSLLFFAGVQLMSLGILGEYIGRIFSEVKRRPLYLVAERIGLQGEPLRAEHGLTNPLPMRLRTGD
ncbi:MAG: glycosyltransferase family 2 protein [Hyphomicrobiales bacterium]|nr:glycosyltransferase family 2 protein [Hyphomicrobiales bacterium]MDE2114509.1 glycosyltransferase family 2 protein [Hyphomicrobiales bacterium]